MATQLDLSQMKVLVTGGAGTGVGAGVCQALHAAGATLLINDVRIPELDALKDRYPGARLYVADLTVTSEVDAMFEEIAADVGPITGLVNNAGIGLSKVAHEVREDEFDRLFGVNVRAVWDLSRRFAQQCIGHSHTGSIVNISSVHAHSTMSRYAIYCSAKNAVLGLTKGMAVELGPMGIRVNAVGPGYVHAEQNLDLIKTWTDDPEQWIKDFFENQQVLNYEIRPIDIGQAVAFLLSDLAHCITGQNIYVDNGTTSLIFNRDYT